MKRSKADTGGFLTVARFHVAVAELNAAIVRRGVSDAAAWRRLVEALEAKIAELAARVAELEERQGPKP